ncbi:unnamed protein product [Fraxinus pennsylvanica]|uniref:BING4 C-terminal domain-containing protein n=1 Tax=Fraxinus pennsylvanica TaxID=56036 RepID=A0AAD1YSK4_9LAMI|nr:unnamed protein product [Fraxinus pennsylvanica]
MGVKIANDALINPVPAVEKGISEEEDMNVMKYMRGEAANLEVLQDKKLKGQLAVREDLYGKSAKAAAKAEKWLMPSEGGYLEAEGIERTWNIKQEAIAREVDILGSRNQYDIILPDLGPYSLDFTPSGRYVTVAGRKGHMAILDMKNMNLIKEFQVRETVRDVVFLHNEMFFAAAQKKYTYIYDRNGTELHCLKEHGSVLKLQFLNKHFLLASINKFGQLHYQDVTTGEMIGNFRTGLGRSDVMQVNPINSVVAVGHSGGAVSMWKPTSSAPLVKMFCHHGPVTALAFHSNGHLMATAGMERKIKLWDLRKFEVLRDLSGSQNYSRYMSHSIAKGYQIQKLAFRPYEDVLGIGHSMGWSSILIPGSREANFDSWVANPFETSKQRKEREVHSLLDKLPPETIMLNPTKIGSVKPTRKKERPAKQEIRGRIGSKVAKKKKEAVEKAKKPFLEQAAKGDGLSKKKRKNMEEESHLPGSLQRFARKRRAN